MNKYTPFRLVFDAFCWIVLPATLVLLAYVTGKDTGHKEGFYKAVSCVRGEVIFGRDHLYGCDTFPLFDGETLYDVTCGLND